MILVNNSSSQMTPSYSQMIGRLENLRENFSAQADLEQQEIQAAAAAKAAAGSDSRENIAQKVQTASIENSNLEVNIETEEITITHLGRLDDFFNGSVTEISEQLREDYETLRQELEDKNLEIKALKKKLALVEIERGIQDRQNHYLTQDVKALVDVVKGNNKINSKLSLMGKTSSSSLLLTRIFSGRA